MKSLMQKNEPPIRLLSDVKSDMTFAEFTAEMDTANLREVRIYFSSGAISENIGLTHTTHILYLERVTSATATVLAFPLTYSKNFYKLNMSSSTWGSWITIDNDSIESEIQALQTQVNNIQKGVVTVTTNNTVADTSKQGYFWKQEVPLTGITSDSFAYLAPVTTSFSNNTLITTNTDTITLYFTTKPATNAQLKIIYWR